MYILYHYVVPARAEGQTILSVVDTFIENNFLHTIAR